MKKIALLAGSLMVATAVAAVGVWLLTDDTATSQQQRPEFAGVPVDVLEEAGVHLTLPVQATGLISESEARAALEKEYFGANSRVKEVALANLKDTGAAPYYNGPAWIVSLDTTGKTESVSGGDNGAIQGKVEWHLLFLNARTGEYLGEIQLNNYAPEGWTPGPEPPSEGPSANQPEPAIPTPSP